MSCMCAKRTDEYHGWKCEITDGACMYLMPNQDVCADEYGEVEHTDNYRSNSVQLRCRKEKTNDSKKDNM